MAGQVWGGKWPSPVLLSSCVHLGALFLHCSGFEPHSINKCKHPDWYPGTELMKYNSLAEIWAHLRWTYKTAQELLWEFCVILIFKSTELKQIIWSLCYRCLKHLAVCKFNIGLRVPQQYVVKMINKKILEKLQDFLQYTSGIKY